MMDSELDLAVSYYQLYNNLTNDEYNIEAVGKAEKVESSDVPWEADEWTAAERALADEQLAATVDRCRVPTSATVEDDTVAWDRFYGNHQTNFFKDRHYLVTSFPQEFLTPTGCWVEVGCGVGNAILPLLETDKYNAWRVYGIDLSTIAIQHLREDPRFQAAIDRSAAWPCDITTQQIPDAIRGVATVTSLLFCLSAIHPKDHLQAVRYVAATLQPGGVVVLRDYGRYDEAQLKLGRQRHKLLLDNFYRKADGTKCYYFTTEEMEGLMKEAGLEVLNNEYLQRVYRNRSDQTQRRRVWVQGRFLKPKGD